VTVDPVAERCPNERQSFEINFFARTTYGDEDFSANLDQRSLIHGNVSLAQ